VRAPLLAALPLLLLAARPASAQVIVEEDSTEESPAGTRASGDDRLSFSVQGSARVPADQIDLEFTVEGSGEDGATAQKQLAEKLKKVSKALGKLKAEIEGKPAPADEEAEPKKKKAKKKKTDDDSDDDTPGPRAKPKEKTEEPPKAKDEGPDPPSFSIEVKEGRSTVGVNYQANANGQPATDMVTMATCLIVKMKGIADVGREKLRKRLATILDTAIEAGADSGFNGAGVRPSFRFRAKDNEELRALAQEDAVKKGRARAKRLAAITGRELGKLKSVTESRWMLHSGRTDEVGFDAVVGKIGSNMMNNYELTVSTTEIELECTLTLDFELGKAVEEKTQVQAEKK